MTVELVCPFCRFSREVSKDKIPVGAKSAICPNCKQRFEFTSQVRDEARFGIEEIQKRTHPGVEAGSGYISEKKGAPWGNRSDIGVWQAIFSTLKVALFSPGLFFKSLTLKGGLGEPFSFGLIIGSLGGMFGLFWHFLEVSIGSEVSESSVFGRMSISMFFLTLVVAIPLIVAAGIYIYSGILHLMLLMLRGGKNGFGGTFRVVAYSQAAQIWGLVPFIGGFVGGIWQLIVMIIGLKEIQETTFLKVIMAFIIPLALILMLVFMVMIPILFKLIGF